MITLTINDEWATPPGTFKAWDAEFNFTLDPCATKKNAKCKKFYTAADDGLSKSWKNERVFCNPPYSDITTWSKKCLDEWHYAELIALLIYARTDQFWFHEHVLDRAELRFLKKRLYFLRADGFRGRAPAPSILCIYRRPPRGV